MAQATAACFHLTHSPKDRPHLSKNGELIAFIGEPRSAWA